MYMYESVYVSDPEKLFELRTVVQCRNVCSEEQHGFSCLPPLLDHRFIKPT